MKFPLPYEKHRFLSRFRKTTLRGRDHWAQTHQCSTHVRVVEGAAREVREPHSRGRTTSPACN